MDSQILAQGFSVLSLSVGQESTFLNSSQVDPDDHSLGWESGSPKQK